jgi:hypothetical protein
MNYKTIFLTDSWHYWYEVKNDVISRGYQCDNFISISSRSKDRFIFFTDYDATFLSRLIKSHENPKPHKIITLSTYED